MAEDQERIRVLIADEQSLFREALAVVLANEHDFEVIAQVRDGTQAVSEAARTRPHVVLIEANLPNCDGIRATQLIKERIPECKVIVLTGDGDPRTLLDAMEAGASGYVSKASPLPNLIGAARAVYEGDTVVPPKMLGLLLDHMMRRNRHHDEAFQRVTKLTRREREVLALLSEGADNDTLARDLVISPQTARTHVQNVLTKLGVHSRLEAAAFVTQNGVFDNLVASEA